MDRGELGDYVSFYRSKEFLIRITKYTNSPRKIVIFVRIK